MEVQEGDPAQEIPRTAAAPASLDRHPNMNHLRPRRAAVLALSCALALGLPLAWLLTSEASAPLDSVPVVAVNAPRDGAAPVAAGVETSREEAVRYPGHYAAPAGANFGYDLRGRFEYSVRHPEGGAQRSGMNVQAQLQVGVVSRDADTLVLRAELRALQLSALAAGQGAGDPALAAAAAQPFFARIDAEGRIQGYQFAASLDGEQRNFVRGVFASFLHTVPVVTPAQWEAADVDAAGEFVAQWQSRTDGERTEVARRKLRYTTMAGKELHPHEIAGGSQAVFDAGLRWLRSVEVDECMTMTMQELALTVELRSVLRATLTSEGGDVVAATGPGAEPFVSAAGHREDLSAGMEASERARWQQQLAGTDLDALVADLQNLLAQDPQDPQAIDRAWQAVIWTIKLDPAQAAAIRARVAGMDARLADLLVSALGAAGTEAAQDVLAAMRLDAGSTPALRQSATVALFQVAKPGARVLGDLVGGIDAASELSGDQAMAVLLLGALAPRAANTPVAGRSAFERLVAYETKCAAQGRADLWLNALANVGRPECLPHVQRYVDHEDERVRAAAYHALRLVDTAPSTALLERGLGDASPAVRSDVVNALGQHRSEAACAALVRVSREDADAAVRRATLDGLGTFARKHESARAALAAMAAGDPDADNQLAARVVLEGLR